jgi:hypothetical protein
VTISTATPHTRSLPIWRDNIAGVGHLTWLQGALVVAVVCGIWDTNADGTGSATGGPSVTCRDC